MDTKTNEEYQNEIEKIKSKKYLTVNEREKIIEEIHNLQNESKQEKDVKNKEKLESQATKKRRELSESYMKLVLRIASKYADTPKEIMDLAADGTIGLINGIDNYTNNNRETPFSNYIHNYIEQAIQQKIKTTPEEEVPSKTKMIFEKIEQAEKTYLDKGKTPTIDDLVTETNLSKDFIDLYKKQKKYNKEHKLLINNDTYPDEVAYEEMDKFFKNVEDKEIIDNILSFVDKGMKADPPRFNYRTKGILIDSYGLLDQPKLSTTEISKKYNINKRYLYEFKRDTLVKLKGILIKEDEERYEAYKYMSNHLTAREFNRLIQSLITYARSNSEKKEQREKNKGKK